MKKCLRLGATILTLAGLSWAPHFGGGHFNGRHIADSRGHCEDHHHFISALSGSPALAVPHFGSPFYYGGHVYGYRSPYRARVYDGRPVQKRQQSIAAAGQLTLADAGYYRGRIDGVVGERTHSAIRFYERRNRLPVAGRIDDSLLEGLGI